MASRQLGKLRQWAGERISSRDKTIVIEEEVAELEEAIQLRKQGIIRLQAASEDYYHVLTKKKESTCSGETTKLMPLDALGVVMITHGEEYGDDSSLGSCLVALGRAHCKVATLQDAYGLTFQDTFIKSCDGFIRDIKEYELQRKKLDSRRLSYDAALTKLDKIKNNKKEKERERREAEYEVELCRERFEETSKTVRLRIQDIQDNEASQLRELTDFLDIQLNFAKQYFEILDDVKANWCDESTLPRSGDMRSSSQSPPEDDRFHTIRSKRSTLSSRTSSAESVDNPGIRTPMRRKSDAEKSTNVSRPDSRASRKRTDSNVTTAGTESATKPNKRMSIAGWATNAVSSITGLGKKDRDTFSALMNEDEEKDNMDILDAPRPPSSRSFSRKSPKVKSADVGVDSPKANRRVLKSSTRQEKVVSAMFDFSGSRDSDLSFKAGDEITVIDEPLDLWWLGRHKDGREGLFPVDYVRVAPNSRQSSPFGSDSSHPAHGNQDNESVHNMDPPQSASSLFFDNRSISSTVPDDEEERFLMPVKPSVDDDGVLPAPRRPPPPVPQPISWNRTNSDLVKSPPPPAPPRRSALPAAAPPIPARRLPMLSTSNVRVYTSASNGTLSHDASPFDSLEDTSSPWSKYQ